MRIRRAKNMIDRSKITVTMSMDEYKHCECADLMRIENPKGKLRE